MFKELLITFLISSLVAGQSAAQVSVLGAGNLSLAPKSAGESLIIKPVKKSDYVAPYVTASSAMAYDLDSDSILFQKNINEQRPMGSINKLMTAMIILDGHKLEEVVTVSKEASKIEGSKVWIFPNEKLYVRDLIEGMLIPSGNDAAVALAIYDSVTEMAFVEKMNQKAKSLGMSHTNFSNSSGFDSNNNVSTSYDLMLLARAALQYDFIRQTVSVKSKAITSLDFKIKHKLETTNELLNNSAYHFYGLKTGTTPGAGPSFIGLAEEEGHHLLTIILNSGDRFQEAKLLVDWSIRAYDWYTP